MTVSFEKVSHKLINKNGWSLWLPGKVIKGLANFGEPDIYTQSSIQLYPLGAKLEFADGRVFRYGKWGATSTNVPLGRMVVNANRIPGQTDTDFNIDGFEGNLYVAAAVGDTYVDLWETITAQAENFFEDGMLAIYPASQQAEYRICGSELGTAAYCRIYLDNERGLRSALTIGTTAHTASVASVGGTGVTAYRSIYSQLKDAVAEGSTFVSSMGVCLCTVFTSGYYGWIQRRGRCVITPTAYFGDTADERMAQLHTDGCIALKAAYGTHTVGYLTQRTVSGYGDLEVWLQLE